MVDPANFTNFKLDGQGLQEYALFSLMVFNKNADQTAKKLERFLTWCRGRSQTNGHFAAIRQKLKTHSAFDLVKEFKFGNTTIKSNGLEKLVNAKLDLWTCTPDDLETIPGFGMKTSRFFILHTQENARCACLDTHILQWLKYYTDEDVPKSTPSRGKYLRLEKMFLNIADAMGIHPAILDIRIWNKQRGSESESHL